MHRRRYLQTVGASLAPLVAGCSLTGPSETPTENPTRTETDTPARTPTETDQYADSPGDVNVPRYIELLPDKHLGGTERTDNANFLRVDWEWYLEMRDHPMEFGAAADSDWTLEPTEENFATAPEYDILKGPVNAVFVTGFNIENIIGEFPNAGPEMLRQCGLAESNSVQKTNPEIKEVITYAHPGVMLFVGVDTNSLREAVQNNDSRSYDEAAITGYSGVEDASDRTFLISDENETGIVAFESANEELESLRPTLRRLAGYNQNITVRESVRWCLSRLEDFPVVTGEINGGRQQLAGSGYSNRGISQLPEFDTLFQAFTTTGDTAKSQLLTSHVNGPAPTRRKLEDIYSVENGSTSTHYHPDISTIATTWA